MYADCVSRWLPKKTRNEISHPSKGPYDCDSLSVDTNTKRKNRANYNPNLLLLLLSFIIIIVVIIIIIIIIIINDHRFFFPALTEREFTHA